jgi:serine/threonine protein kinase
VALKVFIIDDSADYRALLAHHITARWPGAVVKNYDPVISGHLPDGFSGAGNDVVLLGHPAGQGDALDWMRKFSRVAQFPPVIFIGNGDERQIVEAMKAGAAEYISKSRLNHACLLAIMDDVLGTARSARKSSSFFGVTDPVELEPPNLKGYEIQRRISVSDLAAVYLARENESQRVIVLKILRQVPDAGGEVAFDRFLQEYELIAKVLHPNVVKIFDLGVADDHAYIAMEFCSRGSLKRRISKGLKKDVAFGYMRKIAGALAELHRVGILHRDLKPTNVMFRDDDSLVLIDFGLAKQAALSTEITGTGEIFGTPYYMSPEQGHAGDVDNRSDIYALGVIFFEMLTGKKPYGGETAMSVIIRHNKSPLPKLPQDVAVYQPAIDRMMAKKPEDRFQTVEELLEWQPVASGASVA